MVCKSLYAQELGSHAVEKLVAHLESVKGGSASALNDEQAVKEDSEEKPKLEPLVRSC